MTEGDWRSLIGLRSLSWRRIVVRVAGAQQVNTLRSKAALAGPLRPGNSVRHCACVAATQLRHLWLPQSPAMGQPRRGFFHAYPLSASSVGAPPPAPPTSQPAASASLLRTGPLPQSPVRGTLRRRGWTARPPRPHRLTRARYRHDRARRSGLLPEPEHPRRRRVLYLEPDLAGPRPVRMVPVLRDDALTSQLQ
jgi:hypothetical protein